MKILIVGSDINAKLMASYLKIEDNANDIYITTDEHSDDKIYTPIGIQENDVAAICDFVKYNQIEFTVVTSSMAMINGISDEFKKENFCIFSPTSEAARITFFNSIAKKIMYKLKINTPRFGIFDRENMAVEYVRNMHFPIVISNDFTLFSHVSDIYDNFAKAKLGIQKNFENGNNKIVIENYVDEEPIYLYFITDGYNALPLMSITENKNEKYISKIAPSGKITENILKNILQRVIYPILDDISKYADMYTGIIGIKVKIHNNSVLVLEFYNSFQSFDLQTFIPLINDNLFNLLYDSANSGLMDNRDFVNMKDDYSYTIAVNKAFVKEIEEDDDEFIITENDDKYIFTAHAATINNAKDKLFDYLKTILEAEVMKFILEAEKQKEIRV